MEHVATYNNVNIYKFYNLPMYYVNGICFCVDPIASAMAYIDARKERMEVVKLMDA